MNKISAIINRIVICLTCIGAVSLLILMLLMVAVVVFRFWRGVIFGSYEMIEFAAVTTVAFALVYAAYIDTHTSVSILVDRISKRKEKVLKIISLFIHVITLGLTCWAGVQIFAGRWLTEKSTLLKIPYFPFRGLWVFAIGIFGLITLVRFVKAIKTWIQ